MNLQVFVNDTTDFTERIITIQGITQHIYEQGIHRFWTHQEQDEIESSALRFFVGDKEGYGGATYSIPDEFVLSLAIAEREIKFLPPGSHVPAIEINPEPLLLSPDALIDDLISAQTKAGILHSRTAGYLRQAANELSCKTLQELSKKGTRRKLATMPGVGTKVINKMAELFTAAGLPFRD